MFNYNQDGSIACKKDGYLQLQVNTRLVYANKKFSLRFACTMPEPTLTPSDNIHEVSAGDQGVSTFINIYDPEGPLVEIIPNVTEVLNERIEKRSRFKSSTEKGKEEKKIRSKHAREKTKTNNDNWQCISCSAYNSKEEKVCKECKSSKTDDNKKQEEKSKKRKEANIKRAKDYYGNIEIRRARLITTAAWKEKKKEEDKEKVQANKQKRLKNKKKAREERKKKEAEEKEKGEEKKAEEKEKEIEKKEKREKEKNKEGDM